MSERNLKQRLETLVRKNSTEKNRKILVKFSGLMKEETKEGLEKVAEEDRTILGGLAQSVLFALNHERTEFEGEYAGSFITVNDDRRYSFEGEGAGIGSSFEGEGAGIGSSFKGKYAGIGSSFKGKYAGIRSSFKGYRAGEGSSFEGEGAGKGVSLPENARTILRIIYD